MAQGAMISDDGTIQLANAAPSTELPEINSEIEQGSMETNEQELLAEEESAAGIINVIIIIGAVICIIIILILIIRKYMIRRLKKNAEIERGSDE